MSPFVVLYKTGRNAKYYFEDIMSETLQLSRGLRAVIEREGLVPGDEPGKWVKPEGIDMNRITLDAIALGPVQPKAEHTPPSTAPRGETPSVHDGADSSGILALRRRERLKDRMARILKGDRWAIGRQAELESEAGRLVTDMARDPGLRGEVEGVVARLPVEEQAYVARLLRERGDPSKQIVQNVAAVRKAEQEKQRLLEKGFKPIGGGLGDSMVVTSESIQLFVAGMEDSTNDTSPDVSFPLDALTNGRLTFDVDGSDGRQRGGGWSLFPKTVCVTDTRTGKKYELRGVRDPDKVIQGLLHVAETITAGARAGQQTVELLRDHPEMLE
ncbi:MAG: hypothetical protein HY050_03885 [Actinobacteria bacterium]|nr:hypothetical protein [Actinomycetota bacterium]